MLLSQPEVLVLTYTQAMLAALLFRPEPRRMLIVGLGGGSLAKFLLRHFPDSEVEAVECRREVIRVARDYFALPQDPRLKVHAASALQYLQEKTDACFDLIFVDVFDAEGMDRELEESAFFRQCRNRLSDQGVVSANLWASRPLACRHHLKALRRAFAGQVLELPAPACGNLIALGMARPYPARDLSLLKGEANHLAERIGIDFPDLLARLRRRNRSLLRRLLG
jgi:spermidine synthase